MNIIFSNEFKECLKRIDNTLYITEYVIGTKYDSLMDSPSPENIRKLFSGEYLANDLRKTGKNILNSLIEKNTLKAHIKILDKELLTEPSSLYDFIYVYGIFPDGSENIIMLLVNIVDNKFQPLDINITDNIINISLPEFTESTIITNKEEDTKFLEGIGINKGVNIYSNSEDLSKQLVTKESYYKFIREKNTDGDSISFLYNNFYGERIFSKNFIDICESINIHTLISKESEQMLSKDGGFLKLLGTANFKRYKLINNYDYSVYIDNMNIDIISLSNTSIIIESNTGINLIDIDNRNNRIIYGKNSKGSELSVIVKFRYVGLDLKGNIVSIFSNEIKLIQPNI